jgi:hypothetical protein
MKYQLILLSLLSLAPLATACGGNDETLTSSLADESTEADSLGSSEEALRVDPSAISTTRLEAAERADTITLPAVSDFDLPDGLRARLEQTGKQSFTLSLDGGDLGGGVEPGSGGTIAAKSFWGELVDILVDQLKKKAPKVECTSKVDTTTGADGTIHTTVTTTCTAS